MSDGLEGVALFHVPFHLAVELTEDLSDEGASSQDSGLFSFAKEECNLFVLANDVAAIIEGRRVLSEPVIDLNPPTRRQQVLKGHDQWLTSNC